MSQNATYPMGFKNHCQAEVKGGTRKIFKGRKQERPRAAATRRAAGVRPGEAEKAGEEETKGKSRDREPGQRGVPKSPRNTSSHSGRRLPARTVAQRTLEA